MQKEKNDSDGKLRKITMKEEVKSHWLFDFGEKRDIKWKWNRKENIVD